MSQTRHDSAADVWTAFDAGVLALVAAFERAGRWRKRRRRRIRRRKVGCRGCTCKRSGR